VVRVPASSLSFLSNSAGPSLLRPHRTPPSSVRAAPQLPPSAFHQAAPDQFPRRPWRKGALRPRPGEPHAVDGREPRESRARQKRMRAWEPSVREPMACISRTGGPKPDDDDNISLFLVVGFILYYFSRNYLAPTLEFWLFVARDNSFFSLKKHWIHFINRTASSVRRSCLSTSSITKRNNSNLNLRHTNILLFHTTKIQ
jgi:hypothetical protein